MTHFSPAIRRRTLLALAGATALPHVALATAPDTAATWRALSRLGYGPTPALLAQVQQAGAVRTWALGAIDAAYNASQRPILAGNASTDFDAPLPEIFARFREERMQRKALQGAPSGGTPAPQPDAAAMPRYSATLARATAAWRIESCSRPEVEHPLLARLTEFWFNHLNVSADKGGVRPFVGHYLVHAIRTHALGRFDELLLASARHPAMLNYLDQAQSVADGTMQGEHRRGLNENYARELMELHTLGVHGGYTQQDVRELARVLTGWTLGPREADGFRFAPRLHDTGRKTVLGQDFGGSANPQAGQAEGIAAIRMLAQHPATARRIALRMAQWFVADEPPQSLVDRLAETFLRSHGDIRALLRTLVQSDAFWDASHTLFKTPYDYVCSALAATGGPQDERELRQALNLLQTAGQPLDRWPTPDGYKTNRATWLAPEALTLRADYAMLLARRNPDVDFLAPFVQPATRARIAEQPSRLRSGLLLASPDFMSK